MTKCESYKEFMRSQDGAKSRSLPSIVWLYKPKNTKQKERNEIYNTFRVRTLLPNVPLAAYTYYLKRKIIFN